MSKIKSRHIDLTDNFTFTGIIEAPTPSTGTQAGTRDYVDSFDGFQGNNGFQGARGFQGSNGFQGIQGSTGNTGVQGANGVQGNTGPNGFQGTSIANIGNNILINGGFDFAQRLTPGSFTTVPSNTYGPDRWKVLNGGNSSNSWIRGAGGATNVNHYYYGTLAKNSGSDKFLIYQIIESKDTFALRGRTVLFQFKLWSTVTATIRTAILEHTGTIDSVASPAFTNLNGSNGTDPTKGSNISNIAVVSAINGTSTNSGITGMSCSLTASANAAQFGMTVTIPSTANNLIFAFWTDSALTTAQLSLADIGAYADVTSLQPWNPRTYQQELEACQRYYEKSYNIETALLTSTENGCFQFIAVGTSEYKTINYKVTKRTTPTIDFYGTTGSSPDTFRNITASTNVTVTPENIGESNTSFSITSGISSGQLIRGHYTIDAEL